MKIKLNESCFETLNEMLEANEIKIPTTYVDSVTGLSPIVGAALWIAKGLKAKKAYAVKDEITDVLVEVPKIIFFSEEKAFKEALFQYSKPISLKLTIKGNFIEVTSEKRLLTRGHERMLVAACLLLAKNIPLTVEAVGEFFSENEYTYSFV